MLKFIVAPSRSRAEFIVAPSRSRDPLITAPLRSRAQLIVALSRSHAQFIVAPSRARAPFQVAPSRSRDLFQVAPSRAHTPLIAAPPSRPRTPLRRPQRAHLCIAQLCAQLHAPSRRSNSILIAPLCTQASSRRRALTLHCAAMRSTFIGPFYLTHVVRLASNFSAHSI